MPAQLIGAYLRGEFALNQQGPTSTIRNAAIWQPLALGIVFVEIHSFSGQRLLPHFKFLPRWGLSCDPRYEASHLAWISRQARQQCVGQSVLGMGVLVEQVSHTPYHVYLGSGGSR